MSQVPSEQKKRKKDVLECLCLSTCSNFIQHGLETLFGNIGRFVGNYPWITIISSIIITCSFGLGFQNWTTESRVNKLWVPPNTKAEQHSEWVSEVFGYETRTEYILLGPNDNGNVLKAKYVEQYWYTHYLMVNYSSPAVEGYEDEFPGFYSWNGYNSSHSICLRLDASACDMNSILDIVGYSKENITSLTDEKLLQLINDPIITARIDLPAIIGGLEFDNDDKIISGAVFAGTYKVEAKTIVTNNAFIDPSREQWELDVTDKLLQYDCIDCRVIPSFVKAFGSEFAAALGADATSYVIGCTLLIIYTTIALGKRDYIHSMLGISLCAILTVALSVLGGYGLAGALSIIYTPLSSSLPFLVLGLGVDDAFIIAGEFQQQIRDNILRGDHDVNVAQIMQRTMKHAGVSILITSLTDVLAFSIGSTTVLPALRAFCLFAAFSVCFVFMLNITFFAACVVIDHKRANNNRMDCCCCFKLKTYHPMFPEVIVNESALDSNVNEDQSKSLSYCCCLHKIPTQISRKMFKWLGEKMMNIWVKIIILFIAMGMFGFSIYGATQLKQDFKIEWFIPDTSYLQDYYAWRDEYFETGTPIFIYSKDINYLDSKQDLFECNYLLKNASYLNKDNVYDWHLSFWHYVNQNNILITQDNYYINLQSFLHGVGGQYNALIAWKNATQPQLGLNGAFMIGKYKQNAVLDAASQVDAMFAVREDMIDIVGSRNDDIFAFTFQMLFWEQYAVIAQEFYRNLVLAICVVFAIALILIPKISAALLVILAVIGTIVDVLGFMWLWGLTIDAVTVCYTVIAIGLAVDYSAHVGEAFMLSQKVTKAEKIVDSLYRIGSSVFNGAFSTFLAVVAMAGSQTYIFRVFFRQFFLVTLIGSVHGLIVLPVLLSWFGPNSNFVTNDEGRKKVHIQAANNSPIGNDNNRTDAIEIGRVSNDN